MTAAPSRNCRLSMISLLELCGDLANLGICAVTPIPAIWLVWDFVRHAQSCARAARAVCLERSANARRCTGYERNKSEVGGLSQVALAREAISGHGPGFAMG
jgi:hypothetical protein